MNPLVKSMKLLLLLTIIALLDRWWPSLLQTWVGRTGLVASVSILVLLVMVVVVVVRSLANYRLCLWRLGRRL